RKEYETNADLCKALGIDTPSIIESPLASYIGCGDVLSGICIGLQLAKDTYHANQDHAPTESHDEFLSSLPEGAEGAYLQSGRLGHPNEKDEAAWADDGGKC